MIYDLFFVFCFLFFSFLVFDFLIFDFFREQEQGSRNETWMNAELSTVALEGDRGNSARYFSLLPVIIGLGLYEEGFILPPVYFISG